MSQAIPHWTPEMLDAYNLKLSKAKGQIIPPPKKLPGKKPKFDSVEGKLPAGMKVDLSDLVSYQPGGSMAVPFRAAEGKQSKTEQKYNREVLGGKGRFEAVTLHLPGGGRYTPDFMTIDDGVVTFHEVKGSYRLGSQGRAYTAFHEAAAYYPMWRFVWAHWTGKAWERKTTPWIKPPYMWI